MKHYFLTLALLVVAALPMSAQYYHSNKGDSYYNARWYDSSFREYMEGMKAGEASSALRVIRAYLYEKGTPRDVKKAISIMEQWAEKDPGICFFASAFYDPYFIGESYRWYDREKKLVLLHPGYVYDIRPVSARDVYMETSMEKALKYSEKLEKKFKVSSEYSITLRERNRENTITDKIELLSLTEGGRYSERFLDAIHYCKNVEDLNRLIAVDQKSPFTINDKHYFDYYRETGSNDRHGQALAEKYLELIKPCIEARNGDLEAVRKDVEADPKMAGMREYMMPIYTKFMCNRDVESVKYAMEYVPYAQLLEPYRIKWSRESLFTLIKGATDDWKKYDEVFSSPIFMETSGQAPFSEKYIDEGFPLPEAPEVKVKKEYQGINSSDLEDYYKSILDNMDRINRDIIDKDSGVISREVNDLSTLKADYAPLIDRLKERQILGLRNSEILIITKKPTEQEREQGIRNIKIEYPFGAYLMMIAKGKEKVDNENLKRICSGLEKDIKTLNNDFPDNETANKEIRIKKQYLDFASLLLAEKQKPLQAQDYLACKFKNESFKEYVSKRLRWYKNKRRDAENTIATLEDFPSSDVKKYRAFQSSSQKAKRTAPEMLTYLRDNIVLKNIDACEKAAAIYPLDPPSNVYKNLIEENEIINIALAYCSGKNVEEDCARFFKIFPGSVYNQLIKNYSNDSYALRAAGELNAQSSKEDIKKVLDLPMTKDASKQVKELVKKNKK